MKVEKAVQVKAGLVWSFLIHGTRNQKVLPTDKLLWQAVCWVQSINWYCDASKWVWIPPTIENLHILHFRTGSPRRCTSSTTCPTSVIPLNGPLLTFLLSFYTWVPRPIAILLQIRTSSFAERWWHNSGRISENFIGKLKPLPTVFDWLLYVLVLLKKLEICSLKLAYRA